MEYETIRAIMCVGFVIFTAWLALTLMVVFTVWALQEIGAYDYVKDYIKQRLLPEDVQIHKNREW